VDVGTSFIAQPQATMLMEPTQRSFHDPTEDTETATMFRVSFGQYWLDTSAAQLAPMWLGIIRPISLHLIGTLARPTGLSGNWRNIVDQGHQLGDVVAIGGSEFDHQRNAIRVRDDVVFRAFFAAIRGIRAGLRPPKMARTEAESTTARDQSILSASRRWASNTRWSLSHTPALCQSRSRRQQVMPLPHPNSLGRYSHGMPVMSTNRIPMSAWRLPIGFLPGNRNRRGLGLGKIGSMIAHNASSRIGFAMIVPPCTAMTVIGEIPSFC